MASYPTISLAKKSTGAPVALWQSLLSKSGYQTEQTAAFDAATDAHTRQWQKDKGLVSDGVVGLASWEAMTGEKVTPPATTDKHAQFGRDTLLKIWPLVLAEAAQSQYAEVRALGAAGPPNLAELQIAGAMAHLESNYGMSPYTNKVTGQTSGVINNWGAVQGGKPPCDPSKAFEVTDTGAQGSYNFCYKKYATPEDGALDFLRLLTVKRPASWALMKQGDIDAFSVQMHTWTPPLEKLGAGKPAGTVQNKDPITGMPGYFEQPPIAGKNSRAAGLEQGVANIAHTLGEPVSAKRGGPTGGQPVSLPDSGSLSPATRGGLGALAVIIMGIGVWLIGRGLGRW